jgi:hypothetical protein
VASSSRPSRRRNLSRPRPPEGRPDSGDIINANHPPPPPPPPDEVLWEYSVDDVGASEFEKLWTRRHGECDGDDRRRAPRFRFHDGGGGVTTTTSVIIVGLDGISEALRRTVAQHRCRESLPTEPTPEPETERPTAVVTATTTETTTGACGDGHKMAVSVDPRHGNDDAARKPPAPLLRPSSSFDHHPHGRDSNWDPTEWRRGSSPDDDDDDVDRRRPPLAAQKRRTGGWDAGRRRRRRRRRRRPPGDERGHTRTPDRIGTARRRASR